MFGYVFLGLCLAQLLALQVSYARKFNYQKCPELWGKEGCRVNTDRGLTSLFDDRRDGRIQIDWDNFHDYLLDLACRCREAALELKHSWFALENYGICFSAPGRIEDFFSKYPLDPGHNCVGTIKLHNKTIVTNKDGKLCIGGFMRAYFYRINTHGGRPPTEPPVITCDKISDVVLVIDSSGSIGSRNFKRVKEFIQKFVDRYDFSKGRSRLAIVTYDSSVRQYLNWQDSQTMKLADIRNAVDTIKYTGGSTMTHRAVNHVIKFIIKPFRRKGVPTSVFLITDGKSWRGRQFLRKPSRELETMGVSTYAIGVSKDVDLGELMIFTRRKTKNIFLFTTFAKLIDRAAITLNKLINRACIKKS